MQTTDHKNTDKIYSEKEYRFILVGNPNSGKTTIFNLLTGLRYKVGNYAGVTVESKEGNLILDKLSKHSVMDVPGIYSLVGISDDEQVTLKLIQGELIQDEFKQSDLKRGELSNSQSGRPDGIILTLDCLHLERNLFLATQIIDLGYPTVGLLTMTDLAEERGIKIYPEILRRELDIEIFTSKNSKQSQLNKNNLSEIILNLIKTIEENKVSKFKGQWFKGQPVKSQQIIDDLLERDTDKDTEKFDLESRYFAANNISRKVSKTRQVKTLLSESLDKILLGRLSGVFVFFLLMLAFFNSIFTLSQYPMSLIENSISYISNFIGTFMTDGILKSLILDGVISGVGNVIIFVPQVGVLFLLLGILDDSGYLARAAFIMDRLMRPFGLQGRSFIPLLNSFGCAIPGILSTRTIPSRSDRLATILVAPLMSCSARLPVYTVLIAAFIPASDKIFGLSQQGVVLFVMYALGIIAAGIISFAVRRTILKGESSLFLMEVPPLRLPNLRIVLVEVYDRVLSFLKSAGSMILACSIILWFLASFPRPDKLDTQLETHSTVSQSYAAQIGKIMEPAIKPIGFNWEIGFSILASFAAREVFISSLSTIYNLESTDDETSSIIKELQHRRDDGTFTKAAAYSLMVFYVFSCQCMSTLAVCRRETGSWTWVFFIFIYMSALAYIGSFITYRIFS